MRHTPVWALGTCGEPNEIMIDIKKNTHPKNVTARFRDREQGMNGGSAPKHTPQTHQNPTYGQPAAPSNAAYGSSMA